MAGHASGPEPGTPPPLRLKRTGCIVITVNPPLPGSIIGHYRILHRLGAGGMGVVYEAEDLKLGRHVALKLLAASSDPVALERFWREARTASALNHPGICTIYEINETEDQPFLVMEMLEGQSLDQMYSGGRAVPLPRLVETGIQVADALDSAHRKGILHRDIKPGNIFVTTSGQAKILDFGLARFETQAELTATGIPANHVLTTPGTTLGTVAYMSPEQARGEPLDARSDIFSLGVVLYEMATGRHPFAGTTTAVMFDKLLNYLPPAPVSLNGDLPPEFEHVLGKALEKDRELRYQSAADLRADLRRLQRAAATPRIMPGTAAEPHPPSMRDPGAASVAPETPAPPPPAPSVIHPPNAIPRATAGSSPGMAARPASAGNVPGAPASAAQRSGSSGRVATATSSGSGQRISAIRDHSEPLMLPSSPRRPPEDKTGQSRRDLFTGIFVVLLAVGTIFGAGVWSRATHEVDPGEPTVRSAADPASQTSSAPPATAASLAGTYPAHQMHLNGQVCDGSLQITPTRLVYACGVQSVTLYRTEVRAIEANVVIDSGGKSWPVHLDGMTAAQVHQLLARWFAKKPAAPSAH